MTALARMAWFHTRRLWGTSFFVQLLVLSVAQIVCLQALSAQAGLAASGGWIRASLVGIWTVSTVSAGIIGFQRLSGTLVHLVRSPRPAWQALAPVVAAVSTLGSVAVPLSLALSALLRQPIDGVTGRTAGGLVLFWAGSFVMATVVSSVFVLSRYATTYEALIGIPLVLLSDIFGHPPTWDWFAVVSGWLPTAWATRVIFDDRSAVLPLVAGFLGTTVAWGIAAVLLSQTFLKRATQLGTLEVV